MQQIRASPLIPLHTMQKIVYDLCLLFTSQFSVGILTGEEGKYSTPFMERAQAISNAFPQKSKPVPNNYIQTVNTLLNLQKVILQTVK